MPSLAQSHSLKQLGPHPPRWAVRDLPPPQHALDSGAWRSGWHSFCPWLPGFCQLWASEFGSSLQRLAPPQAKRQAPPRHQVRWLLCCLGRDSQQSQHSASQGPSRGSGALSPGTEARSGSRVRWTELSFSSLQRLTTARGARAVGWVVVVTEALWGGGGWNRQVWAPRRLRVTHSGAPLCG